MKPVGGSKKEKKIEESFASFLCTTMQSGSGVVGCFTRNTLGKEMPKKNPEIPEVLKSRNYEIRTESDYKH